ncbi:hypothetical protein PBRA_005828 [Plasmodiophora brassicae]|nr:hypothetical protein PBRA_005828 [Plasmodiophora brassicae]
MHRWQAGDRVAALRAFDDVVATYPMFIDGYLNAAAAWDAVGDRSQARSILLQGARLKGPVHSLSRTSVASLNKLLCESFINDAVDRRQADPLSGDRIAIRVRRAQSGDLSPVDDPDEDAAVMVECCKAAVLLDGGTHGSFANLGKMWYLLDNETLAIDAYEHAKGAASIEADIERYASILDQLFDTEWLLSSARGLESDAFLRIQTRRVSNRPSSALDHQKLGAILTHFFPFDERASYHLRKAQELRVHEIHNGEESSPRIATSWEEFADDVTVLGSDGQRLISCDRLPNPIPAEAGIPSCYPLHEHLRIVMTDVTMEGASGVLFTRDKVYFSNYRALATDYTGGLRAQQSIAHVSGTAVLIHPADKHNWYHWLIEGVTALVMSLHFLSPVDSNVTFVIPSTKLSRRDLPLFELGDSVLWYDTKLDASSNPQLYTFERLLHYTWRDSPSATLNDNLRSRHASSLAIRLARSYVLDKLSAQRQRFNGRKRYKVIYVSRRDMGDVRSVYNEGRLLAALHALLGPDCMHEFVPDDDMALLEQAHVFSSAVIVIGPHGAGLSNILFAAEGASLVYFPLRPMLDFTFANLAAAIGVRLYPVTDLVATPNGPYTADSSSIDAVVQMVSTIAANQGGIPSLCPSPHSERTISKREL